MCVCVREGAVVGIESFAHGTCTECRRDNNQFGLLLLLSIPATLRSLELYALDTRTRTRVSSRGGGRFSSSSLPLTTYETCMRSSGFLHGVTKQGFHFLRHFLSQQLKHETLNTELLTVVWILELNATYFPICAIGKVFRRPPKITRTFPSGFFVICYAFPSLALSSSSGK